MAHIDVNTTPYSSGSDFSPKSSSASVGGHVTLHSQSGSTLPVYTYMFNSRSGVWEERNVFVDHSSPYNATTDGKQFTLRGDIEGTVELSISSTPPSPLPQTGGSNGTLDVGGVGGGETA